MPTNVASLPDFTNGKLKTEHHGSQKSEGAKNLLTIAAFNGNVCIEERILERGEEIKDKRDIILGISGTQISEEKSMKRLSTGHIF